MHDQAGSRKKTRSHADNAAHKNVLLAITYNEFCSISLTKTDLSINWITTREPTQSTMFEFQQQQSIGTALEGRDPTWWYPIQSAPSQDMWELPATTVTTSISATDGHEEHDFSPRLRRDDSVEAFSMYQHTETFSWSRPADDASEATGEENIIVNRDSRSVADTNKREVLGDATNTIRRRSTSTLINSTRLIRRSNFTWCADGLRSEQKLYAYIHKQSLDLKLRMS